MIEKSAKESFGFDRQLPSSLCLILGEILFICASFSLVLFEYNAWKVLVLASSVLFILFSYYSFRKAKRQVKDGLENGLGNPIDVNDEKFRGEQNA